MSWELNKKPLEGEVPEGKSEFHQRSEKAYLERRFTLRENIKVFMCRAIHDQYSRLDGVILCARTRRGQDSFLQYSVYIFQYTVFS